MLKFIASALLVTLVIYKADGFAFAGPLVDDTYCLYEGIRFEIGQNIIIDCVQCNCYDTYMSCAGIGYKAGVISMENCRQVQLDNCCYQFFRIDDPTASCTDIRCP